MAQRSRRRCWLPRPHAGGRIGSGPVEELLVAPMDPCRLTLLGAGCAWVTYPPGSVDDHAHQVGIPPVLVAGDLRARLGDERMRRAADALRAARQGIPAVSDGRGLRCRHLLARLEPGRAGLSPSPRPGREAGDARQR